VGGVLAQWAICLALYGDKKILLWRVLIVEDDALMRDFFAASVQRCPELVLVGAVSSIAEALRWLGAPGNAIDVLLTDLGLPDGSGMQVIRHARLRYPECEALVISMFGDEENVLASIEAGALGYIHKDAAPDDIAVTILEMKRGASPISPMIARRVLSKYVAMQVTPAPVQASADSVGLLSVREQEVLAMIARGFSYAEISRIKGISVHTVQTHIKSLYRKLAVHSKNEAVFEATV
jgi:DNA-binding NarL/FixJ family response regulator